jgi:hypothetical protein
MAIFTSIQLPIPYLVRKPTNGTWPSAVSLVGPQGIPGLTGPQGATGPQGPAGINGSSSTRIGFGNSTTWICPQGVSLITVEVWGAGGGGGGCARSNTNSGFNSCVTTAIGEGGNGGSGGHNQATISVIPGNSYSIIVGIGGSGGAGANQSPFTGSFICASPGLQGGSSSFDGIIVANGGAGGVQGCARVSGGCLQQNGANGANASVLNYPLFPAPPTRSYIQPAYLDSPPSCCAQGGLGKKSDWGTGAQGENGLIIISY